MTEEKGPGTFPCPACRTQLNYKAKLKLNCSVAESSADQERPPEFGTEEPSLSTHFTCPECRNVFMAEYSLTIHRVLRVAKPEHSAESEAQMAITSVADAQLLAFVEKCRANGTLQHFADAVHAQTVNGRAPVYMDRYFASFLRRAEPTRIPHPAISYFAKAFDGWVEFWSAQNIGMVLVHRKICRFVPMRSMNMNPNAGQNLGIEGVDLDRRVESFEYVKRTSVGYIPPECRLFFEAVRHSGGDRGRTMRDIPLNGNSSRGRRNGRKG